MAAWILVALVMLVFTGMGMVNASGQDADSQAPTTPGGLIAEGGAASPVVTHLTWDASTDNVGVTNYRVWRSASAVGPFESIGDTSTTSFDDVYAIPGPPYWYQVSARDAAGNESGRSEIVGPAQASWYEQPHGNYPPDTEACALCHRAHTATQRGLTTAQTAVCYLCHDGQGSHSDIRSGAKDSFSLTSGHSLEESGTSPDLTDDCSSCHDPHREPSSSPMLPNQVNNHTPTASNGPGWCLTCHDDANSWYQGSYPATGKTVRNASGYPVLGTFPGATVYQDASNAHGRIPETTQTASASGRPVKRSAGDCLYCHAAHRGPNQYDGLVDTYRAPSISTLGADQTQGTYAAVCLACHGGVVPSGFTTAPADIKQFVTSGGPMAGHRIQSSGGTLPAGAPLPCYDCHGEHGSKRNNKSMLSDELGQNLDTSSPEGVRQFCLSCHTSGDFTRMAWDSQAATYTAASATDQIEGLSRTSGLLGLPPVDGHRVADLQSCYGCHGGSYGPGGNNVHDPTVVGGSLSAGGSDCYGCHTALQLYMEDNVGAKVGASNTSFYHHVLGSATADGDKAFASGSYPGPGSDVYCLSCHVDHDKFNSNNGANLRADLTGSSEATNTDYDPATGGVCLGCHNIAQAKDTTNQKAGGSAFTPSVDATTYAASPHNYPVTSTFDTGFQFKANCAKCHNDEQAKFYQIGPFAFSTHFSLFDRLLGLIGILPQGSGTVAEANACANCHGGGGTADFYNTASMTTTSTSVWSEFQMTGSSHPITAADGVHRSDETTSVARHVVCEDCHNPHASLPGVHVPQASGSMAAPVLWGTVGYQPAYPDFSAFDASTQYDFNLASPSGVPADFTRTEITSATPEAFLCLRCHSQSLAPASWPATVTTKSGTYAPTDVAAEFSPANASGHNVLGSLTQWPRTEFGTVSSVTSVTWSLPASDSSWLKPGWSTSGVGSMVQCSDCHTDSAEGQARGPHGSSAKWILDPSVGGSATGDYATAYLSNTGISGNPICVKCHQSGTSFLGSTNSPHGQSNHHGASNGKCINCHVRIPHGWKRPRMIGYTSDPAPYAATALHAIRLQTTTTPNSWSQSDCSATCHGGSVGTAWP